MKCYLEIDGLSIRLFSSLWKANRGKKPMKSIVDFPIDLQIVADWIRTERPHLWIYLISR